MRSRKQAGVIYVEALVVVPMLIALFAGTVYVGRRYDERIAEGQRTRERAWSEALPGCPHALYVDDLNLREVQLKTDGAKQIACNEVQP